MGLSPIKNEFHDPLVWSEAHPKHIDWLQWSRAVKGFVSRFAHLLASTYTSVRPVFSPQIRNLCCVLLTRLVEITNYL